MTSLNTNHLPFGGQQDDRPSRGQALYKHPRARTLPIPDLRFEQSYLRSLQRFIHYDSENYYGSGKEQRRNASEEKGKCTRTTARTSAVEPGVYGVPLHFDWGWILYLTTRDQVLSPLAQGAVWALVTQYLRPFLRNLGAWIRTHSQKTWKSIFPPFDPPVHRGVGWMRDQFRSFTIGGNGTNIALAK